MRISNLFHYTENHRFVVTRDFSLSPFNHKVLQWMYQPMVGALASSLYQTLYHQLPADMTGYAKPEQQRKIFLSLDLDPSEQGRKTLAALSSKLEATGLLSSYRVYIPDNDEYLYVYKLHPPLDPVEFFKNQHLLLLLQDKIGKHSLMSIKDHFILGPVEELTNPSLIQEDLSSPFYDIFRLDSFMVDYELEEAIEQLAATAVAFNTDKKAMTNEWEYADIIQRFPKDSVNRQYVENLNRQQEELDQINYIAHKYDLSLVELCRLLDEDGVFTAEGQVRQEVLQHKASTIYHQTRKREESRERFLHKTEEKLETAEQLPKEKSVEMAYYLEVPDMFAKQCTIHQYNLMLRNESYLQLLKRFFPGSIPEHVLKLFERLDINYKLNEEVINVLIHYLKHYNLSWNRAFVEAIASDMLGRQISTFEQAVDYIRSQRQWLEKRKTQRAAPAGSGKVKKPELTAVTSEKGRSLSSEDLERILQKAKELEGQ